MRVAHVFPIYGQEMIGGGEFVEYHLSRGLAKLGIHVDVYTTKTRRVVHTSAVGLKWPRDYSTDIESDGSITILRFDTKSVPSFLGYLFSLSVLRQWKKEGINLAAAEGIDQYMQLAQKRSALYNVMYSVGRGPMSRPMYSVLLENAENYDVIVAGFIPFRTLEIAWKVAKKKNKPLVVIPFFHPEDVYHHWKQFYRIMREADRVLALNDYTRDLLIKSLNARAVTIGAGIDIEKIEKNKPTPKEMDEFVKEHQLGQKDIVLVVGRKEASKNYQAVIEAVKDMENVQLLMAGSDMDKQQIVSKNTTYLGEVSDKELNILYEICDVFALPSKFESLGLVLLEAWYRKKPVIGNAACNPVKSIISDGEDGFLFNSIEDLKEKITKLIIDKEMAARLGTCGYNKVVTKYNWDDICLKVKYIFEALQDEKRKA
jgi:glycosyltransferase involved in cell wall biosynthesis